MTKLKQHKDYVTPNVLPVPDTQKPNIINDFQFCNACFGYGRCTVGCHNCGSIVHYKECDICMWLNDGKNCEDRKCT